MNSAGIDPADFLRAVQVLQQALQSSQPTAASQPTQSLAAAAPSPYQATSTPSAFLSSSATAQPAVVSGPAQPTPPKQHVYPSLHTLPPLPVLGGSGFQPALGFSSLAPPTAGSLASRAANEARLGSASRTLPPAQQRARRGAWRGGGSWGPSISAPSLWSTQGSSIVRMADVVDGDNIKVQARIYPHAVDGHIQPKLYHINTAVVCATLRQDHCLFEYDLDKSTTIIAIMDHVKNDMQHSPCQYQFSSSGLRGTQPFTLLALKNRACFDANNNIALAPYPVTPNLCLEDLIMHKTKFANDRCVDPTTRRFIINLAVSRAPLGHYDDEGQLHSCQSPKLLHLFPDDHITGRDDNSWCQSGGESDVDTEVDETPAAPVATPHCSRQRPPTQASPEPSMATLALTSLPTSIWDGAHSTSTIQNEVPPGGFYNNLVDFTKQVYRDAVAGLLDVPSLDIEATSIAQGVDKVLTLIDIALDQDDFSVLLSTSRHFSISLRCTQAFGDGVEDEILFATYTHFMKNCSQFLFQREGGFSSIKCLQSFTAVEDPQRKAPPELSPATSLFIIADFNLHALTPTFVNTFFPDLCRLVGDWITLGPDGDPRPDVRFASHFATYHDSEVSAFLVRNEALHNSIAVSMLYKALIGPEYFRNPDFLAFVKGFLLPCRNGFSLQKALRKFPGGPSEFFTSTGNFANITPAILEDVMVITPSSADATDAELLPLQTHLGEPSLTFKDLIMRFLSGHGIPCSEEFERIRHIFSQDIDLEEIDSPKF
ncbi:hypothetical protein DXG01_000413 [Tephrocybe rancida]|nr:hypothetical protein DXG01_000413 [Tephrocybe rancida]